MIPSNYTDTEFLQELISQNNFNYEIEKQLTTRLIDKPENANNEAEVYCKQIEILEEQVCLRDEFIEKIVDKCDQSGSKKDLIRYIKTEFEKGCLGY